MGSGLAVFFPTTAMLASGGEDERDSSSFRKAHVVTQKGIWLNADWGPGSISLIVRNGKFSSYSFHDIVGFW